MIGDNRMKITYISYLYNVVHAHCITPGVNYVVHSHVQIIKRYSFVHFIWKDKWDDNQQLERITIRLPVD